MRKARMMRAPAAFGILAAMLVLFGNCAGFAAEDIEALNRQVVRLFGERKYQEAAAVAERTLALAEPALGPAHAETLTALDNLASLYRMLGRSSDAEPLYRRALAGREETLGAEHAHTLVSLENLASLYQHLGRLEEAEPLAQRALAGRERVLGPDHADMLKSASDLGELYQDQGRYGEAEPLLQRVLAARERMLGADHLSTLGSVEKLAMLHQAQGRYREAEPLLRRVLAGRERALGPEHGLVIASVSNLATLHLDQGRLGEAEALFQRALAGSEQSFGAAHRETLRSINNLATLYQLQGRFAEAEPLMRRVLEACERTAGPGHPDTLASLHNLGALYQAQRRYDEAGQLFQRALTGSEKSLGPEHPYTLSAVSDLADLYQAQSRYDEAEPLFQRALAGNERTLGAEHPATLASLRELGRLYQAQGRLDEAELLLERALGGSERILGAEHPTTIGTVDNLGELAFARGDWQRAAQLWRRSTAVIAARTRQGTGAPGQALTGRKQSEAEQQSRQFRNLLSATYRLADGGAPDVELSRDMFQTVQWALGSEAARSLSQMAARSASGNPALAALVRERQDLVAEWQRRELMRNAALGQPAAKRNAGADTETATRMTAIDTRIAAIDQALATSYPDYAALADPVPLTVEEVQAQLQGDEALVMFLSTSETKPAAEETFVWVVTRAQMRWVRIDLGAAALAREVQALRCGLDYTAWEGARCPSLTGEPFTQADYFAGQPLPFDHSRAHRLYEALFGGIEDLIKGRHLLLVPSGALTQLPFHVLVTAPPSQADHRAVAWLARDHDISVLPAVSSLKALRSIGRPSAATKPLAGFGNPLLDGQGSQGAELAQRARLRQSCLDTAPEHVASLSAARGSAAPVATRGGLADLALLKAQSPLPETADELCAVARALGAEPQDIRLGSKASEHGVKTASESGDLARYRIVHFATHGVMAGQLDAGSEPGLILTPPASPSAEDDGYLTASEIAGLRLDADFVILSACNTAAGAAASAEALSGLARAFFYAQARALLVSHWEVNSDATVKLVTAAMREMARDRSTGRAEALRRAMLALIDNGAPHEAHPAYWAPFVVVGEGTR